MIKKKILFSLLLLFLTACGGPPNVDAPTEVPGTVPLNRDPLITPISDQIVNEGSILSFQIQATDPDGDSLNYAVANLPPGSSFDINSQIFNWNVSYSASGSYSVLFLVSDNNGGQSAMDVRISVIDQTPPVNNQPPSFNSLSNQAGVEGSLVSFQVSATDSNGDTLTYTLSNPPTGSSLNSSNGIFTWTPSTTQSGNYSLQFLVSDGNGGSDNLTVPLSIADLAVPLTLGSTNYSEGEYSDFLMTLSFNLSKPINSITAANWNNFFTIIDNNSTQTLNIAQLNQNNLIQPSQTSGNFSITLKGSAKTARTGNINFTVNYADSSTQTFSIFMKINSEGKPLFRYDIINALTSSGGLSVSRFKIINQIKVLNAVMGPFMTGIFEDYQEKTLPCGSDFVFQHGDGNNHQSCVSNQISSNSETVIFFETVTTSSGSIGGLSLGTRNGALVSNSSFNHTLIHELGHNFGLTHTHETYSAGNLHHSGSNNGVYSNGIFRRLVYSPNESLFGLEYGDGISDTDIDPYGSQYVASLNGGSSIFSSFNGAYEGESHFLYHQTQPVSTMFTASAFTCFQEYSGGDYFLNCPGFSSGYFDHDTINNIMSYWYKIPGQEHITNEQALKILNVLSNYPEII